ncbi:MAG: bacilysin biosynthesis protein BacC [Acidobacteria bacterium]|nr:MAG: bacilysin biosynthesis protein BacC [Acidobacteriota bacterium]
MEQKKQIAVITGATTGIGEATKQLMRERGCTVYNLDLAAPENDSHFIRCDVRSSEAVNKAIAEVKQREGRIDMLFANAGKHHVATLENTDDTILDELIDINIKGAFFTLRAVIPIMKEQKSGSIVIMGSDQCFIGKGSSAVYGLTKGAVGQLTKSTAIDLAPYGIRVNCICPGSIDTPLLHRAVDQFTQEISKSQSEVMSMVERAQPIARLGKPVEIANAVAFMLSDEASFMTGALISVDGGYVAQ